MQHFLYESVIEYNRYIKGIKIDKLILFIYHYTTKNIHTKYTLTRTFVTLFIVVRLKFTFKILRSGIQLFSEIN